MPSHDQIPIQQREILWGLAKVYRLRNGSFRFRFSPLKLVAALVISFVVGWILMFSAAYFHFKYRRGYVEASYLETLAFPFTKDRFQKKRGEYYIGSAYEAIESGDFREALNLLRNGLLRSPSNLKARRALSEFYEFLLNRPILAFDLLADGIPFLKGKTAEEQSDYIQYLFSLGSRNQLDRKLIEAGETINAELREELPKSTSALVYYQIASGYRNRGEIKKAETILEEEKLLRFSEGLVLQAQLLWDKGMEELSIKLLESRVSQYKDNRAIYGKLVSLLEEKQQIDSARKFAILYQLEHPTFVQSHLTRLHHYYKYKREDAQSIDRFVNEFSVQFSTDQIALRQLAILTSKFGDVFHTQRVLDHFGGEPSNEQSQLLANFILIEAMIRDHQYDKAISKLSAIESAAKEKPISPDSLSIMLSLKIAAYHGKGDKIEVTQALNELRKSPVIKIDRCLAVSYLFLEVDAPEIALAIMDHCLQTRDTNPNIREALISIHLKSKDVKRLSNVLMAAIDERRLPNRLLIDSYRLLSSDGNAHVKNRSVVMDKIQNCFSTDYLFKDPQA